MRFSSLILLIAGFVFFLAGCKKERAGSSCNCSDLREGLLSNDTKRVANSIENLLSSYSESNLHELAATITDHCNIPATVDCFNCIKTNPPETEIIFSLMQVNNTVQKRLDISHTSNNKMEIISVHD